MTASGCAGIESVETTRITNCSYQLHEPKPIVGNFSALDESPKYRFVYDDYFAGMTVDEYVRAIDVHPDHVFDLVLVDGRVRTERMQHAIPKIRPGRYLMLDSSNNADVAEMVRKLRSYPHTEFHGIAPGWPPARRSNTIWQISYDGHLFIHIAAPPAFVPLMSFLLYRSLVSSTPR
jgi:hypothetical protein